MKMRDWYLNGDCDIESCMQRQVLREAPENFSLI